MRAVVQRVNAAKVVVDGKITGEIGKGLLLLLGVTHEDTKEDIDWLVNKLTGLRIFSDADGKMNLSVKEVGGEILSVSQFTLYADSKKGSRPSYIRAASPAFASDMYEQFNQKLERELGKNIAKGIFGADMQVSLENSGPVTIILDSKQKDF